MTRRARAYRTRARLSPRSCGSTITFDDRPRQERRGATRAMFRSPCLTIGLELILPRLPLAVRRDAEVTGRSHQPQARRGCRCKVPTIKRALQERGSNAHKALRQARMRAWRGGSAERRSDVWLNVGLERAAHDAVARKLRLGTATVLTSTRPRYFGSFS